ncbi:MAG: ParB/RepB/Spo0J family partition protein [Rickettsiales bacterium]|jgi:ParB family chromosome partitioning protein|nr:ParB/RepB/Spo0J family partition protein [Rickettsiales bacterium]
MAKFGLGKGLADLETEAGASPEIAALSGMPERVVVRPIPIAQIGANPDQPRKTFSADELEDLAQSIREHGVLQPIIVRTVTGMPHLYEIVAGERRWRASQIAGKETIPALVKPISQESAMEIALIENVQRENLNAIEECDAYKNIMNKCGYALPDLSALIGKSESYIRNIMRLSSLPEKVKMMVKSGDISASHARTLAVSENAEELARKIMDEELSVAQAAQLVKSGPRAKTAKRKAPARYGYPPELLRGAEERLEKSLDIKAKISVRINGAGSMTLYFKDKETLELLIELLAKRGKNPGA